MQEPLHVGHLFGHLRREITLGTYLLDQQSQARFLVLDADDGQSWERLVFLARELADSVIDFYMKWKGCDFKTAVKELARMVL